MVRSMRMALVASLALLIGAGLSTAQQPKDSKSLPEPKKKDFDKKEPPKKGTKKESDKKEVHDFHHGHWHVYGYPFGYPYLPGIAYGWNYYWPGPVLPGMWGTAWGGLWPYSWWMGGPWAAGGLNARGGWGSNYGFWCHGGGHGVILPPVFGPVGYPAVSPFWTPYVAPYWFIPSPAYPMIVGTDDRPNRRTPEYRAVPASATAEKLFADALWLFSEENYASARDHLAAALKQTPRDARMWYFKALSERAMKDEVAATNSAENGASLEILGVMDKKMIVSSLERIQGADRRFLTEKVSGAHAISLKDAAKRVAQLKGGNDTTVVSTGR